MANVIKLKKSGTANTAPSSLEHGELAINYADGLIYYKNLSNTISVANSASMTVSETAPSSPRVGSLWFDSTTGKLFSYYDSYWVQVGGVVGPEGPSGIEISNTAPESTTVLWADTSDLGDAVIPVGGTTGQVLAKASGTAYDTVWTSDYLVEQPRPVPAGGVARRGVPGVMLGAESADSFDGGSGLRYYPFVVHRTLTITEAAVRVTAGTNVGLTLEAYVIPADSSWQPTGLATFLGQVDGSSTGVKTFTGLSITLPPGRYLGELFESNGSNLVVQAYSSFVPGLTIVPDAMTANGGSIMRFSTAKMHDTWNGVYRYAVSAQSVIQAILYRWTEP